MRTVVSIVGSVLGAAACLSMLTSCSKSDDWYDVSKENDIARDQRIDTFMQQGMQQTQAARVVEFEAAWRATEHQAPPPVEGQELQNALDRPPESNR